MPLFSRRRKHASHAVTIHFAQPMSPRVRHAQELGIVGTLLPQLDASAVIEDLTGVTIALQAALGSGAIGWHDETYVGANGPVYVFSGSSAESILAALRPTLPLHSSLGAAELASVTAGAAESS